MNLTLELDYDQALSITNATLVDMLGTIEYLAQPSDLPIWDAIQVVLSYTSTEKELEDLQQRWVDPSFVTMAVEETMKEVLREKY